MKIPRPVLAIAACLLMMMTLTAFSVPARAQSNVSIEKSVAAADSYKASGVVITERAIAVSPAPSESVEASADHLDDGVLAITPKTDTASSLPVLFLTPDRNRLLRSIQQRAASYKLPIDKTRLDRLKALRC